MSSRFKDIDLLEEEEKLLSLCFGTAPAKYKVDTTIINQRIISLAKRDRNKDDLKRKVILHKEAHI